MKKIFLLLLLCACWGTQAQLRIGIKAGANFSDLDGISLDTEMRTGFHFGAMLELKLLGRIGIQPELLYSSQGAKVDYAAFDDIKYDYVTLPVMVKLYIIKDVFDIEVGPQFSFLVNDSNDFDPGDSSTFEFAALGGVGVDLGDHFFLQGRYVLGLTDASQNAEVKNKVIQLSLGYKF